MVIRLNDKLTISMEELKKRWIEAEKNDPYKVVSTLFKEKDYDRIASILKKAPDTTVRQNLAIPAALLLVPNLEYHNIAEEMKSRGVYDIFTSHCSEAQKIAQKYKVPVPSLDAILGPTKGVISPDPEFERMYDIYRE